jgi:hypothetical protein
MYIVYALSAMIFCVSLGFCDKGQAVPFKPSSWMKDLAPVIKHKPLRDLVIPGTHDSATYKIGSFSTIAPKGDIPQWVDVVYASPFIGWGVKKIIANWARAQDKSITQQLEAGIRYLDLRVVRWKDDKFYTCHSLYGESLSDVLNEIKIFTEAHPEEILILDFNHLYNMKEEKKSWHAALIKQITSALGLKMASSSEFQVRSTIQALWGKQKSIIVIYDDNTSTQENPILWSQDQIKSPWPNKQSLDTLESRLKEIIQNPPQDKFFVFQGILTPDGSMIKKGLVPFTRNPSSLQSLATQMGSKISDWVSKWHKEGRKFNIVISDFFTPHYVQTLINLNMQ